VRTIAKVLGVSRSNLMRKKTQPSKEEKLLEGDRDPLTGAIKCLLKDRPTYGYRRIAACLKVNHKRAYRVMKENGLLLRRHSPRPRRTHTGKVVMLESNRRWCSDSFAIQCFNGEQVHVAFTIDACDREAMRYIASTKGIDGKSVQDLMVETVEYRFGRLQVPTGLQWLTDNGACYTARGTVAIAKELGLDVRTTMPYSPESNGVAEAFVKTFKRDYVWMGDLREARVVMEQLAGWFEDYNENAPHKGLKMRSPRQYRKELQSAA
jgi:putative transposase